MLREVAPKLALPNQSLAKAKLLAVDLCRKGISASAEVDPMASKAVLDQASATKPIAPQVDRHFWIFIKVMVINRGVDETREFNLINTLDALHPTSVAVTFPPSFLHSVKVAEHVDALTASFVQAPIPRFCLVLALNDTAGTHMLAAMEARCQCLAPGQVVCTRTRSVSSFTYFFTCIHPTLWTNST